MKKIRPGMALLCSALIAGLMISCSRSSSDDPTIGVAEDDPEMKAAIAKARSLLPEFWKTFDERSHGETDFALKVQIKDKRGVEHFWATDLERKDGKIFGTINNDPNIVRNVKLGDRIEIKEADISDWMYVRNEKMSGNYTLRVLFKQMSAAEVEKYKRMLADP